MRTTPARPRGAFTLLELLTVVAVIAILAMIAIQQHQRAVDKALQAADAANLHHIGQALHSYYIDQGTLPPADRTAAPRISHGDLPVGNGPAAGGSADGLPWILYEFGYLSDSKALFCPKYLRQYAHGKTLGGDDGRYHNFRYAYNSSALSSGGHAGGWTPLNIESGAVWMVRDLYLHPMSGWYGYAYPNYPADYRYPWGFGDYAGKLELVLYSDMAVRLMLGGSDKPAPPQAR